VYVRTSPTEPFTHTVHRDKEEALNVVRKLKEVCGEPKIDFVENSSADVLHFRFKDTGVVGRVVFMKRELHEHVHCPHCGNAAKKQEDNWSHCHGWHWEWVYDHDNAIWRVHTISKEDV
jgi:hypothetical protein